MPAFAGMTASYEARALVHAHGFELVAPGIGDRGFARIGQHDWRAVGRMQREQLDARLDLRRLREQVGYVLGADRLDIGDAAAADERRSMFVNREAGTNLAADKRG